MKNLYGRQQKLPPVVLFCLLFYSYFSFFASPSGKMILNTKKKIIMDTPPVMMVIVSPGISISQKESTNIPVIPRDFRIFATSIPQCSPRCRDIRTKPQ